MKKFTLLTAITLLSIAAFAQETGTKFGIRTAFNFSNLNYSGAGVTSNAKSLFGGTAGVFAEIGVVPMFSIQPEIDYTSKGAEASDKSVKTKLGYIAVPILFKFRAPVLTGLNAGIGPNFAYLISAKDKYSDGTSLDIKSTAKKFDLGLDFEVGYDFLPFLGADIRYTLGLNNVSNDPNLQGVKVKNGVFQIGARFLF